MALMKCPECGHEVSDKAKSCPNCGFPIAEKLGTDAPIKKSSKRALTTIVFISFIVVALSGVGGWWLFFKGSDDVEEEAMFKNIKRFEQECQVDSLADAINAYLDTYNSDAHNYSMVKELGDRFFAEKDEWDVAVKEMDADAFNNFLDQYPTGFYRKAACLKLDSLCFVSVLEEDTKDAYESYLMEYDEGIFAKTAHRKLDSLSKVVYRRDTVVVDSSKAESVVESIDDIFFE